MGRKSDKKERQRANGMHQTDWKRKAKGKECDHKKIGNITKARKMRQVFDCI